jgi:hypothetical protein
MSSFPRTTVGEVSLPRLICGTNWILGYTHISAAKDRFVRELFDKPSKAADVIEVFARNGCNAVMSPLTEFVRDAIREVEQRVGIPISWICTPSCDIQQPDTWKQSVDQAKEFGATFCFPHTSVTDMLIDRVNRRLDPRLTELLRVVREAGMIPGLSTHEPEAIIYSDESNADVESYIQPFNSAGYLCRVETDWMQRIITGAKKPVMTIKPLAAGSLRPPTGLAFVWSSIRDCDMVTIGTMSPYEAEEVIEISLACLDRREADIELQVTRSKKSVMAVE